PGEAAHGATGPGRVDVVEVAVGPGHRDRQEAEHSEDHADDDVAGDGAADPAPGRRREAGQRRRQGHRVAWHRSTLAMLPARWRGPLSPRWRGPLSRRLL